MFVSIEWSWIAGLERPGETWADRAITNTRSITEMITVPDEPYVLNAVVSRIGVWQTCNGYVDWLLERDELFMRQIGW